MSYIQDCLTFFQKKTYQLLWSKNEKEIQRKEKPKNNSGLEKPPLHVTVAGYIGYYLLIIIGKFVKVFSYISQNSQWGKNPQFIQKVTFCKYHILQNSHFQSRIFDKIHIFKVTYFRKFTISNSHFSQNS